MTKSTHRLSHLEIKNAVALNEERLLADGNGLYVRIRENGTKTYMFFYTCPHTKRRKKITLGRFPAFTLKEAREKAEELQYQKLNSTMPASIYEQVQNKCLSFESIARELIGQKNVREDTQREEIARLSNHIFPHLGKTHINDFTPATVTVVLEPLAQEQKLETVARIICSINTIFDLAACRGLIEFNKLTSLKNAFDKPTSTPFKAITFRELLAFFNALSSTSMRPETHCLIEFQMHTIVRPIEAASATWEDIDLNTHLWTMPNNKSSNADIHKVTLSKQVIKILSTMKQLTGKQTGFVFPSFGSDKSTHMSSQTVNSVFKRMGYKDQFHSHGTRALASTTLNEFGLNFDHIEKSMGHIEKNDIRKVYNRASYIHERRLLTQWWSDFLEHKAGANRPCWEVF
ncbi:tyrosine-type recombinase/integrase [Vibrio breoganii]|uniref:tyrosine-type recombinase/integrase n=1 Tax=Vibrio breoganii TaxID=553239 RepID=UPI000C83FBE7|nr:tyrosine-type recombinase/integrase [Vibrio breoganii]PMG91883.1 hypothetical protein BCU79_16780 [Vibrio breoganii]PMK35312.1 hypothetical protein BCU03_19395 [Vibrio breoganii]PML91936.1 hypothetical protein BCT64_17000 [Vibrio breoganii]PMM88900.1 hypothetical protein BCT44_17745 [Vibrio breoganii]PMN64237.1 hypothetical protein BCT28_08395 [Vibrio breoganii]